MWSKIDEQTLWYDAKHQIGQWCLISFLLICRCLFQFHTATIRMWNQDGCNRHQWWSGNVKECRDVSKMEHLAGADALEWNKGGIQCLWGWEKWTDEPRFFMKLMPVYLKIPWKCDLVEMCMISLCIQDMKVTVGFLALNFLSLLFFSLLWFFLNVKWIRCSYYEKPCALAASTLSLKKKKPSDSLSVLLGAYSSKGQKWISCTFCTEMHFPKRLYTVRFLTKCNRRLK